MTTMPHKHKPFMSVAVATLSLIGTVHADGLYGTAGIGISSQDKPSQPYGNNIAVDPDFPAEFDADDGLVGSLGIGHATDGPVRVEVRLGFHQADINDRRLGSGARSGEEYILDGDINSTSLTLEGFYDIALGSAFKPYLKAGIGVSHNRYAARLGGAGIAEFDAFDGAADGYYDAYADQSSTEFTWNVGVGASLTMSDRIALFGEYQYASLGDASTGQDSFTDGFQVDVTVHEVLLGLRSSF